MTQTIHPPWLLVTRPALSAEAFAKAILAVVPVRAQVSPVLRIVDKSVSHVPSNRATLLFTSANGVRAAHGQGLGHGLPAICAGGTTTRCAVDAGFDAVCAGETVSDLIAHCMVHADRAPFWHLRGDHVTQDVTSALLANAIDATDSVCYQQVAQDLDTHSHALIEGAEPVVLPLFSPRSARLTAGARQPGTGLRPICMSQAVAEALPDGWQKVAMITGAPTRAAMIEAVVSTVRTATLA